MSLASFWSLQGYMGVCLTRTMCICSVLGGQAAVAIAHSRLFEEQRELTVAVESARSQLETVLVSTENPVVAVDREFRLIFANPVARKLFSIPDYVGERMITEILPVEALPALNRSVLRDLRRNRVHIYEVSLDNRVFLCHLARLGGARVAGWVAVLNDVTQLKELDRLKSEMVRWASHDLKNPLTGAMLYLDLLSESLDASEHDDARQAVGVIEKQLDRMNRIIRGIMDVELKRERRDLSVGVFAAGVSGAVEEVNIWLMTSRSVSMQTGIDVVGSWATRGV
jgi:signal transduction histidine kinase